MAKINSISISFSALCSLCVPNFGFIILHAAKQPNQQQKRKIVNAAERELGF